MENQIIVMKPENAFDREILSGNIDIWSFAYEKGMKEIIAHILKKSKVIIIEKIL